MIFSLFYMPASLPNLVRIMRPLSSTGTKVKGIISMERFRFSFDTLTQVRCLQTWAYILCEKYEIAKFQNFQNEEKKSPSPPYPYYITLDIFLYRSIRGSIRLIDWLYSVLRRIGNMLVILRRRISKMWNSYYWE